MRKMLPSRLQGGAAAEAKIALGQVRRQCGHEDLHRANNGWGDSLFLLVHESTRTLRRGVMVPA